MLPKAALVFALAGTTLSSPVERRQQQQAQATASFVSTTQNGLGGQCRAMTVVFARGTTEVGNVGTIAGPPFFQALAGRVGGAGALTVQGVDYPADIPGFLAGGDGQGSATMADLVRQALASCPETKVVMAGYSQGGQLVHNAARELGDDAGSVAAAVIFGDPNNGDAVSGVSADKTKVICHLGDNICQGGALVLAPHLTYGQDAEAAADFVASVA